MEKAKQVRIYDTPMEDGSYIRRYNRVVSSVVHGVGQERHGGAPGIVIHRRLQFSTVFLADLPLPSRTCILKRQLSSIVPLVRHLPKSINLNVTLGVVVRTVRRNVVVLGDAIQVVQKAEWREKTMSALKVCGR